MSEHNWEEALDTTSYEYEQLMNLYSANEDFPKVQLANRNLHHKWLRSWSKKLGEPVDNDLDNLVSLSKGDHLLAHYLLWKCSKKGYAVYTAQAFTYMYRTAKRFVGIDSVFAVVEDWNNFELKNPAVSESNRRRKGIPHSKVHNDAVREARKKYDVPVINLYTGDTAPKRTSRPVTEWRTLRHGDARLIGNNPETKDCWIPKKEFDNLLQDCCSKIGFGPELVGMYEAVHWLARYKNFEEVAANLVAIVKEMKNYEFESKEN